MGKHHVGYYPSELIFSVTSVTGLCWTFHNGAFVEKIVLRSRVPLLHIDYSVAFQGVWPQLQQCHLPEPSVSYRPAVTKTCKKYLCGCLSPQIHTVTTFAPPATDERADTFCTVVAGFSNQKNLYKKNLLTLIFFPSNIYSKSHHYYLVLHKLSVTQVLI